MWICCCCLFKVLSFSSQKLSVRSMQKSQHIPSKVPMTSDCKNSLDAGQVVRCDVAKVNKPKSPAQISPTPPSGISRCLQHAKKLGLQLSPHHSDDQGDMEQTACLKRSPTVAKDLDQYFGCELQLKRVDDHYLRWSSGSEDVERGWGYFNQSGNYSPDQVDLEAVLLSRYPQ